MPSTPGTLSPCSSESLALAVSRSNCAPKRSPTLTAKSSWHKPQRGKSTRQKENSKPARFTSRPLHPISPVFGWPGKFGAMAKLLVECGERSSQSMKTTALALLTLVAVSTFLYAQTNAKPQFSQEYIDILGVRVRLGMTKLEIADKLGSQKTNDGSTENFWLFGQKRPWPSSIEFKDGKV